MFFEQIVRQDIGCAAYIVGSNDAGEAAVVDPRIDMVDEILEMLAAEGLRLRYIVETHNHADHVSGHHELAARTGATIAVHESAAAEYPHHPLRDGEELALGEVRLRVIHTPGHRPEHIALAALDTSRGEEPWLVLTGDSLFIGDVARPDLAVDGQEGAQALFQSLHQRLLALPEGTMVYPGHVAGSLCGRVNNRMTGTTVGFEQRHNPALTIVDEPSFVRYMNQSLPQRPPNMARIVRLNQSAEPLSRPALRLLTPEQLEQLRAEGATLLDIRSAAEFAAGHLAGAISVDLHGGQFQNRVGLAVPLDRPLVIVAATEPDAEAAVRALAVIGVERVAGCLIGPPESAELVLTPELSVIGLQQQLSSTTPPQLFDVRELSEWQDGHIAGVPNVPFYRIAEVAGTLDRERPVALICASGKRSMIAASLLERAGLAPVNVVGGMDAWRAAGLPLELAENTVAAGVAD